MPDLDTLTPKDHAEEIAIFRGEIVGALTRQELDHGELRELLVALAATRFRPPKAHGTRQYSVSTLERWYYACQKGGTAALRPDRRSDAGRAQDLTEEQRKLLCDIRREHPSASVPVILRTLVGDGRLGQDAVSAATVRRLFTEQCLDRIPLRDRAGPKARLRWEAERPGALWHGDVCYGPAIVVHGVKTQAWSARRAVSKEIADADLWLPPSKEELVHELQECREERASVLLTGEPGVGKPAYCGRSNTAYPGLAFV